MAILLDRADTSKVVQILGEIPDGDADDLFVTFNSVYDDDSFTHSIMATQEGPWIRSTIPKALVPRYSGLYNLNLFAQGGELLALSQIALPLSQIASSLSNIRSGGTEQIIEGLLVNVVGDDEVQTTESAITSTTQENAITLARSERELQTEVIENTISLSRIENAGTTTRITHHP